jgi:beta-N-acetylhexosaminidase
MKDEQAQAAEFARRLQKACSSDSACKANAQASIARIRKMKGK